MKIALVVEWRLHGHKYGRRSQWSGVYFDIFLHLILRGLYRLWCRVVFVVDIYGHVYALVIFFLSRGSFWIVACAVQKGPCRPGSRWGLVRFVSAAKKKRKKNLGECYTMCNDWTWTIPAHMLSLSIFTYQGRDLDPTGNPCGDMLWDNVKWRSLYCNVWSVPTTYKLTSRSRHRVVNGHSL